MTHTPSPAIMPKKRPVRPVNQQSVRPVVVKPVYTSESKKTG